MIFTREAVFIAIKLDKQNGILVMPRSDAASSDFQRRNVWKFKDSGLRVKRGVTITCRVF